jgi:hypothetical protein
MKSRTRLTFFTSFRAVKYEAGSLCVRSPHSSTYHPSSITEPVLTRGDIERNFPTSFLRDALVAHFSSEYVEVTGCSPDCVLIESLEKIFLKLGQILKKRILSLLHHAL